MTRSIVAAVLVLVGLPVAIAAQQRPNREALQRQVMERFVQNYTTQAGLDGTQSEQFREIISRSFRERREIEGRQGELFRALERQLRPGVAADQDSVVALLDAIAASRQELVDLAQQHDQEFAAFLSPVQRAQLAISFQRFQRQVANLIQRRAQQRRNNQ